MADDLIALETWIGGLVGKLSDAQRRRLARAIATDLRRSQVQRIAAQRNPDGSAYAPRKPRERPALRAKAGRIKRQAQVKAGPMFRKLRAAAYLGTKVTPDEASVGFHSASAARIARVHQEGLRDRVAKDPKAPSVVYARRALLGVTDEDRGRMMDLVLKHLDL